MDARSCPQSVGCAGPVTNRVRKSREQAVSTAASTKRIRRPKTEPNGRVVRHGCVRHAMPASRCTMPSGGSPSASSSNTRSTMSAGRSWAVKRERQDEPRGQVSRGLRQTTLRAPPAGKGTEALRRCAAPHPALRPFLRAPLHSGHFGCELAACQPRGAILSLRKSTKCASRPLARPARGRGGRMETRQRRRRTQAIRHASAKQAASTRHSRVR
jgi:hypothetical protein